MEKSVYLAALEVAMAIQAQDRQLDKDVISSKEKASYS